MMGRMRVAIVAESFLPNVNGVTNSVLRVLEHLHEHGHEAIVIAPGARDGQEEIPDYLGFTIVRVPTVRVPLVDSLPVGVPTSAVDEALREFKPDIIHTWPVPSCWALRGPFPPANNVFRPWRCTRLMWQALPPSTTPPRWPMGCGSGCAPSTMRAK